MALNIFEELDLTSSGDNVDEGFEKCKNNWESFDTELYAARAGGSLGTMAAQGADGVAITGGTADGVDITGGTIGADTDFAGTINSGDAISATSTEINSVADGIGVTIPRQKIINIGDWNMDSTADVNVAHGLDIAKIIGIRVLIRNDNTTALYPLNQHYETGGPENQGGVASITSVNVDLDRVAGGRFDHSLFDSTSFNRGWIIIDYID